MDDVCFAYIPIRGLRLVLSDHKLVHAVSTGSNIDVALAVKSIENGPPFDFEVRSGPMSPVLMKLPFWRDSSSNWQLRVNLYVYIELVPFLRADNLS